MQPIEPRRSCLLVLDGCALACSAAAGKNHEQQCGRGRMGGVASKGGVWGRGGETYIIMTPKASGGGHGGSSSQRQLACGAGHRSSAASLPEALRAAVAVHVRRGLGQRCLCAL